MHGVTKKGYLDIVLTTAPDVNTQTEDRRTVAPGSTSPRYVITLVGIAQIRMSGTHLSS